jgi:cell wall-associated NlpC family hydrolase
LAREQLRSERMWPFGWSNLARNRCVQVSLMLVLFAALSSAAQAKTRHRKRTAFSVALQPFELVHNAVHAVAAPIVENAPRAIAAVAAEPIRVAYYAARPPAVRPSDTEVLRAQPVDEDYEGDGERDGAAPRSREAEPEFESTGDRPMVNGSVAVLRNGVAYAPSHAPQSVKNAIWAVNTIRRRPYVWGGGHGSFYDRGYDCSGTVSFALHAAGAINSPVPSSDLMRFGERGRGRWFTIYSRNGHTFAVIAGLRLDTTDFQSGGNVGPRWHTDLRDTGGYVARHPAQM